MVFVLIFHQHGQGEDKPSGRKAAPNYTIGTDGSGAGVFWSGAMRCPKCRADMELIDYEGVEIDRCGTCNGIWFDVGEVELLLNNEAAAAIDTGDAVGGKQYNVLDDYDCPRCGGDMVKTVDTRQRHIWYETCSDCEGSFFDAGEFP